MSVSKQKIRVDCAPAAIKPWRLERIGDSIWMTFGEGIPRPLGATAEVIPAMRRFLDEVIDADAASDTHDGSDADATDQKDADEPGSKTSSLVELTGGIRPCFVN